MIDFERTAKLVADDMNPLNVVLLQEVIIHYSIIKHFYKFVIYLSNYPFDTVNKIV